MLLSSDISPEWEPADVALFVGLVGKIQDTIRATVDAHGRKMSDDAAQDLIAKALLVAFKSEHMFHGLRHRDMGQAFIECEARLRGEIVDILRGEVRDLRDVKRNFVASLHVEGRA